MAELLGYLFYPFVAVWLVVLVAMVLVILAAGPYAILKAVRGGKRNRP